MVLLPTNGSMLEQASRSWTRALIYVVGWMIIISAVALIVRQYLEIFYPNMRIWRTQTTRSTHRPRHVLPRLRTPYPSRTPYSSPTRDGVATRPYSAGLVASALSTGSHQPTTATSTTSHEEDGAARPRWILRWPRSRRQISIGAVEEGRITRRRRALRPPHVMG